MITNYWLWLAMMCYALSIVTWMMALSKFEVSYAYPFLSIGYILATVVGYFFLGESITISKIIGIGVICIGIVILSRG
ncbi:MAG: SMR family transporter [bacterium]